MMDAVKFIEERDRMCNFYYGIEKGHCSNKCPARNIQCLDLDNLNTDAEELVALVEAWSAAHPRKTREDVFLEQYPEAKCLEDGVLAICPTALSSAYRNNIGGCKSLEKRCADCRREFWMQEVE